VKLHPQQILFLRSNASCGLSFRFGTVSAVDAIAQVYEFCNYLETKTKRRKPRDKTKRQNQETKSRDETKRRNQETKPRDETKRRNQETKPRDKTKMQNKDAKQRYKNQDANTKTQLTKYKQLNINIERGEGNEEAIE
jgi:hypothetical protein